MPFLSFQTLTAAQLSALESRLAVIKVKTGATTRNNTAALANDPHLSFPVEANTTYALALEANYTSNATPGLKIEFTLPSGAALSAGLFAAGSAALSAASLQMGANSSATGALGGIIGTGALAMLYVTHTLTVAGTAGTCQLQWAQNTANASNTILAAGSRLIAVKVG